MNPELKNKNVILEHTFKFSCEIMKYVELLEQEKKFVLANQLLKSGTSIGANYREAQNAESKADFIHKFKIAAKETDETEYWLELCFEVDKHLKAQELLIILREISKIITKIIASSKQLQLAN
jgi:four helix bundle protein